MTIRLCFDKENCASSSNITSNSTQEQLHYYSRLTSRLGTTVEWETKRALGFDPGAPTLDPPQGSGSRIQYMGLLGSMAIRASIHNTKKLRQKKLATKRLL